MTTKRNRTEAAKKLGVSTETLRRWESDGEGPPLYRLSEKVVYYLDSDLDDWLESKRVDPGADTQAPRPTG